jgi:hypothetical protein
VRQSRADGNHPGWLSRAVERQRCPADRGLARVADADQQIGIEEFSEGLLAVGLTKEALGHRLVFATSRGRGVQIDADWLNLQSAQRGTR